MIYCSQSHSHVTNGRRGAIVLNGIRVSIGGKNTAARRRSTVWPIVERVCRTRNAPNSNFTSEETRVTTPNAWFRFATRACSARLYSLRTAAARWIVISVVNGDIITLQQIAYDGESRKRQRGCVSNGAFFHRPIERAQLSNAPYL